MPCNRVGSSRIFVLLLALVCILLSGNAVAQTIAKPSKGAKVGTLRESGTSYGIQLRTNGWGIVGNYMKAHSNDKRRLYQLEIGEIRHPKEIRQSHDYNLVKDRSSRPFIYGKRNNFYTVHAGYGVMRFLGDKAERNGIEVNLNYVAGPSIGVAKPYYLELMYIEGSGLDPVIRAEKYSESNAEKFLSVGSIYGGAGIRHGWGELQVYPGLHGKASLNFDFSNNNDFIKAVELGFSGDIFFRDIPLMVVFEDKDKIPPVSGFSMPDSDKLPVNRNYFISAFASIQFGQKW